MNLRVSKIGIKLQFINTFGLLLQDVIDAHMPLKNKSSHKTAQMNMRVSKESE
jgi:hypothetical protein